MFRLQHFIVDAKNDYGVNLVLWGYSEYDLPCASLQMATELFAGAENSSGFHNYVDVHFTPGQARRVTMLEELNFLNAR